MRRCSWNSFPGLYLHLSFYHQVKKKNMFSTAISTFAIRPPLFCTSLRCHTNRKTEDFFLKKFIIYSGWQQIFKGWERETHALLCSPSQTLTLGSHRSRLSSLGLADLSMRFNCCRRVSLQHKRRLSFRPYTIKYTIAWNTIASVCEGDTRPECTAICISQESNEGKTSYKPTHSSRS